MSIDTYETQYGRAQAADGRVLERFVARFTTNRERMPWAKIRSGEHVGIVDARINQGRWIVDCPVDGCAEASLVFDADPRFVCVTCGAGPFLVMLPAEREGIEAALDERPAVNRNWHPGETVGDLRVENRLHLDHGNNGHGGAPAVDRTPPGLEGKPADHPSRGDEPKREKK